ncbi:MAG TPA: hypothetical protein VK425_03635 [Acidimicrobiales bacterium]|nr:hypothetical protein [Acidimicrobiales bacterium]
MLELSAGLKLKLLGATAVAVASLSVVQLSTGVASASSVAATATIGAGTLSVSVPATVGFSDVLNGLDQTSTASLAIDVKDATGSGAGWNITATSTQFSSASSALATNSVTLLSAPSVACDSGATCTVASGNVSYPMTLPAGSGPPTASKLFNAAASTGLGDQTVTPVFTLAIPASTVAGSYTSTWTVTVQSGP